MSSWGACGHNKFSREKIVTEMNEVATYCPLLCHKILGNSDICFVRLIDWYTVSSPITNNNYREVLNMYPNKQIGS